MNSRREGKHAKDCQCCSGHTWPYCGASRCWTHDDLGSRVIDRTRLRGVQTPQGFRRSIIEDAHAALAETGTPVTDDAAAVEYTGNEVALVDGDALAFKITTPLDLLLARAVAEGRP